MGAPVAALAPMRAPPPPAATNAVVAGSKNAVRKDKRIDIRVFNRALRAVLLKASEEGIPYQTWVSGILPKYISGSLKDISANKRRQSDAAKPRR